MICTKIRQQLNENKLKGLKSLHLFNLTEEEREDLVQCGFNVMFIDGMFIITE